MYRNTASLALLLVATLFFSACSKHSIYETAIGWERSSSGLEPAQVSVDELKIVYLQSSEKVEGDTLVLVHGFGANKDNWTALANEFKGEFNIYAIDLPGHGESSKPLDIGYRIEDQVQYLKRTLDELGVEKFHMMGNSMGGAITASYAATYPEQVQTAVLFDPAGIFEHDSEMVELVTGDNNPLIPKEKGDFHRLLDFVLEKRPFAPWPIMDVMEQKAIANREVNEVIFSDLNRSFESDFRSTITRVQAPTLVVWGKLDRVINYRNADLFVDAIPGSRKVILDDIGHVPMVEVPEQSAQIVRGFFSEQHP